MNVPTASHPQIVYIGGSIRSGTTILSMLLGANPGMAAIGEIQLIFRLLLETNHQLKCSCGEYIQDCPFWSEVFARFHASLPDMSLERAAELTRAVESIPEHWRSTPADREAYHQLWAAMFDAIAAVSGASVLIDSSKTGRGALYRPLSLARSGFPVSLISVVRDPRAVAWSIMRREIDKGHWQQPTTRFAQAAYAGFHWTLTNLSTSALYRSQDTVPYLSLRFEDFNAAPVEWLRRIESAFGLDLTQSIAIARNGSEIPGGHLSSGNEVRLRAPVRLTQQPPTWKTALPRSAKLGITLSALAAYGYHYGVADWH